MLSGILNALFGGWGGDSSGQKYVNYFENPNAPRGFGNPNAVMSEGTMSSIGSALNGIGGLVNSLGGIGNIAGALGGLYSMWNQVGLANDALDLARDQFNFSKNFSSAQLNNQINSYNTNLADRARTRAYTETGNENAYNDWYEKNKLSSFNG